MNLIYADKSDHSPVNLDRLIYIYTGDDLDIDFHLKSKTVTWRSDTKEEKLILLNKVLLYCNASNVTTITTL